ncbi:MAG: isoprenyl transferase [Candidatus Latescibacterota bacterium]|nr:isoprenyl transferase [Candidatus Latescibacterota bacterium]
MTALPPPPEQTQSAEDNELQQQLKASGTLPRHIAIIMDGDRRWAKERGLPRAEGHRHGRESVRDIVRASGHLGIEVLTLYTFSTENWTRPTAEVEILMRWLEESLREETTELNDNNVRLGAIGRLDRLPESVQIALADALLATMDNDGLQLNLALNYGGRSELVDACRQLASKVRDGTLEVDSIDEEAVAAALYTGGQLDPDLLIRCSGEMRLSNFLPWQMVYTEIYFTPVYWPDFRRHHLYEAIREFQQRQRRFGE